MLWGIELDDGHYGPATSAFIQADSLMEAWTRANREFYRVMVVFSIGLRPYVEASRLDYSNTTGSGDPH